MISIRESHPDPCTEFILKKLEREGVSAEIIKKFVDSAIERNKPRSITVTTTVVIEG